MCLASFVSVQANADFTLGDYYALGLAGYLDSQAADSSDSEPFRIAKSALAAAAEKNAALSSFLNAPSPAGAEAYYTSLSTKTYFPHAKDLSERGAAKEMLTSVGKIVANCAVVRGSNGLAYRLGGGSGCSSVQSRALAALGFRTLAKVVDADPDRGDGVRFVLRQGASRLVAMDAKAAALAKEPSLADVAAEFEAGRPSVSVHYDYLNGLLRGKMGQNSASDEALLDYVSAVRTEASTVVRFKYWKGWGDCTVGCMYVHVWEFEVEAANDGKSAARVLSATDYKGPYSN